MLACLLAVLLAAEGRPLFYWGARQAVVEADRANPDAAHAGVREVHAAIDGADLVLRFTFDRPVREALRLPGGEPVSGRLSALLELDVDDDRETGLFAGPKDLRTGADRRIEIATRYLGADPEERRAAAVEVTARLASVSREGRLRTLWRATDSEDASRLSWRGDAVELRVPAARIQLQPRARFILSGAGGAWDGRL